MTILNQPSDGLHSVLVAIHRFLLEHGPVPRDQLRRFVAPKTATADPLQFRQTLNTWTKLGLLIEHDGAHSSQRDIAPQLRRLPLPQAARTSALSPDNNANLWGNDGASDFCRAVSWFLAQDAWTVPGGSYESIDALEQSQLPDSARVLQNNTRWTGLKTWSKFLGFCAIDKGTLLADPTVAVRQTLPDVFRGESELDQDRFRTRLAEALPVLDGGIYRVEVEARIDQVAWQSHRPDQVSTSLSRALIRLEAAKLLRLEHTDDADKCQLTGPGGAPARSVSHFVYAGGDRVT